MRRNTKLVIGGAILLVIIVACSVTLALVLTQEEEENLQDRNVEEIVNNIRVLMNNTEITDGFLIYAYIIPSVDAHQSEYITARDRRMAYVSSFTGSAGTAIIAQNQAALWTDGRYHIQAESQLDASVWTLMKQGLPEVPSTREWLIDVLPENSNVGIDPFLISSTEYNSLAQYLSAYGHTLVGIRRNLVDEVWIDRPSLNLNDLEALPIQFSGKNISEKVREIRAELLEMGAETHIVSSLVNIAWLLNLRGSDVTNTPVFFSYVIISRNNLLLFLMGDRNTPNVQQHFESEGINVDVRDYSEVIDGIEEILSITTGRMLLSATSEALNSVIPAERRLTGQSPILMKQVIKNEVEAQGLRRAHIRDGVAVIRYLHWLEQNVDLENITEISGPVKLREFRLLQEHNRGLSFGAISAVGSNAAMAHFQPQADTARTITKDDVYLIDSGGQYLDGTTDITRTIHLGEPSDEVREAFTRVLKGQISLVTTKFPPKAPFSFFDAMARRYLWDIGLNYAHGTGHGIGSYLSVHEYPPTISSSNAFTGMHENMFSSNEPGYYKEGDFGIRIENIIQAVRSPNSENDFDGLGILEFYDVTMVPIQIKMIKIELLTHEEIKWLNEFHNRILVTTESLLREQDESAYQWLIEQTRPISMDQATCNEMCSKRNMF